jgi:hypothetical protein
MKEITYSKIFIRKNEVNEISKMFSDEGGTLSIPNARIADSFFTFYIQENPNIRLKLNNKVNKNIKAIFKYLDIPII